MYSLNVSVPGSVTRLAADLHPHFAPFERVRDRHSLVVKRFGDEDTVPRLRERLRVALEGTPPFETRTSGIDTFKEPIAGPGPVVYLAVESPGLLALHERLVESFGAVAEFEGPDYVPHVTLARDGPPDAVDRLTSLDVEPIAWTVRELDLWDSRYGEVAASIRLPA